MESLNEGPKLMTTSSLHVDPNPVQNTPAVVENEEALYPVPITNHNDTQNINVPCEQLTNISSPSDHPVPLEQKSCLPNSNSASVDPVAKKREGIQSVKPKQLYALRGSPSQGTFNYPKIIQIPPKLRRPKTSTPAPVTNKMPILNARGQILPSEMSSTITPSHPSSSKFLPWERSQSQKLLTTTRVLRNIPAKPSLSKVVEGSNRGKILSNITNSKKPDSEIPSSIRQRPRSIQAIPLRSSSIINNNNNLNKSFSNLPNSTRKPQNHQSPILIESKQRQRQSSTLHKNSSSSTNNNRDSTPKFRLLDEIKRNLKISPYNHSALPNNMTQGVTSSRPRSRQQREKDEKSTAQRQSNSINSYNNYCSKNTSNFSESSNLKRHNNSTNSRKDTNGVSVKTNRFQSEQLFMKKLTQQTESSAKLRSTTNNINDKAESKSHSINTNKNIRDKLIEKLMNSANTNIVEKPIISLPRIVSNPFLGNSANKKVNILIRSTKNSEKEPEKRQMNKTEDKNRMVKVRRKESRPISSTENSKINKISTISKELLIIEEEKEKSKKIQEIERQSSNTPIPDSASIIILNENVREDKVHEIEIEHQVKLSEPSNNQVYNNEESNMTQNNTNNNNTRSKDSETSQPVLYNKDDLPFPIPKELMKDQEFVNEFDQDSSPLNPRLNSPVSPTTSRQSQDPREKSLMSRLARQIDASINDDITSDDDEDEEVDMDVDENESCHSSSSSHRDGEIKNITDGARNSCTQQKEIPNAAHDFVSDYLQLESLREFVPAICRTKICNAVKGADPSLTLEQLVLAKSRFLQLPIFSDPKFFTKIKVPPHICLRGKQHDKDLVTIQYLQTKMDDLYQKKLKNLEEKRTHQQNSSSSSSSSSSSENNVVHSNTSKSNNTTFVVHQGNRKGVSLSSSESYVKSLERVLYSLQHPKWTKNSFAVQSKEDDHDEEDDEEEDQDSNSNTSEDEKIFLEQVKSNSPVDHGESVEERSALAKRILNMYTKGQKKIKLNSGGGDASNLRNLGESDKDEDNDKQDDEESESELHLP